MKVKFCNTIYDGEKEPVMVILSDEDKRNIANMHPGCSKYVSFPSTCSAVGIELWMKGGDLSDRQPLCFVAKNIYDSSVPIYSADEMRGHEYAFIWWEREPTKEERDVALPCIANGGIEINFPLPPKLMNGNLVMYQAPNLPSAVNETVTEQDIRNGVLDQMRAAWRQVKMWISEAE